MMFSLIRLGLLSTIFVFFLFSSRFSYAGDQQTYNFKTLVNQARQSIVSIRSEEVAKEGTSPLKDYFRLGKHLSSEVKEGSLGTGFIIHPSGLILTNYHVIAPPPRYNVAKGIRVQLSDQRVFSAEVIGKDEKVNVALLRIKGENPFPRVIFGDSEHLDIGEWVMAIGNPFGIEESITVGVVSGMGRSLGAGPYDHFIQTDAIIHAGNTGGPLYNIRGEVIGMNTTVGSSGHGIGFAIPINMVQQILPMLEKDGKVIRGWLGVMIQTITRDLARAFKMENDKGALVAEVMQGSPAREAGLLRGDVIVKFDGKEVVKMHDLPTLVAVTPVGKRVVIDLIREGEALQLDVEIRLLEEE